MAYAIKIINSDTDSPGLFQVNLQATSVSPFHGDTHYNRFIKVGYLQMNGYQVECCYF